MNKKHNDPLSPEERSKLLWQLYDCVLATLINIFKNPSSEISGSLLNCTIKFLKVNGITLDNRPAHSEIEQGLKEMYELPFDKDGNPMLKRLKTQ